MGTYKAKGLVEGYKIGFPGAMFVAVPAYKARPNTVVVHEDKTMNLRGKEPVMKKTFKDKYGRGDYTLWYYEWRPSKLKW